jgi:hypothetical protein
MFQPVSQPAVVVQSAGGIEPPVRVLLGPRIEPSSCIWP